MKKLVLGIIPDNFDSEVHYPLGLHCFYGKEIFIEKVDFSIFKPLYKSKDELIEFDNYVTKITKNIIYDLYIDLNSKNKLNNSFNFWKIITFPWLVQLVGLITKLDILITNAITKYENVKMEVEILSNSEISFKSEMEIIRNLRNPFFIEWLASRIIEKRIPSSWVPITINKQNTLKCEITNINNSLLDRLRSKHIYGFKIYHRLFFHFLLIAKKRSYFNKQGKEYVKKEEFELEGLIKKMLSKIISFNYINITIKNCIKGKSRLFGNQLYYDVRAKAEAAFSFEKQESIITCQHGGHNYGSAVAWGIWEETEMMFNYFISWGDGIKSNRFAKVIPLPSPLLSKYIDKHNQLNKSIILVGTDMPLLWPRFDSTLSDINSYLYRKNKLYFISNLSAEIDSFYYKAYNKNNNSLDDLNYFRSIFPKVKYLSINLHKSIRNCKLLVLDHPGTTWNIAMVMNTPLLLFWNRSHFPFNKEADVFLNRFKNLEIYFENPEDAAQKVNKLNNQYEDLSEWWNQKEIQGLRKEWMNKYARADKNWFKIWTKVLWNLK